MYYILKVKKRNIIIRNKFLIYAVFYCTGAPNFGCSPCFDQKYLSQTSLFPVISQLHIIIHHISKSFMDYFVFLLYTTF